MKRQNRLFYGGWSHGASGLLQPGFHARRPCAGSPKLPAVWLDRLVRLVPNAGTRAVQQAEADLPQPAQVPADTPRVLAVNAVPHLTPPKANYAVLKVRQVVRPPAAICLQSAMSKYECKV